jgi:inactivated superfamily I helicase
MPGVEQMVLNQRAVAIGRNQSSASDAEQRRIWLEMLRTLQRIEPKLAEPLG